MMESARKGLWKATDQQLADIAKLHTDLVNKYKPSCSGFVCDNAKLREYIASRTDAQTAQAYQQNINQIREAVATGDKKGMVMKKEELSSEADKHTTVLSNVAVAVAVLVAFVILVWVVRRRRRKMQE